MESGSPVDYSHYIENENAALPATAIHRHAQAGYHTTRPGEKVIRIDILFDAIHGYFIYSQNLCKLYNLFIVSACSWNNDGLRFIRSFLY